MMEKTRPTDRLQLVESYLGFFAEQGHLRLDSGSLIPEGEDVLFTSAGMQPLKPYFLGEASPPSPRLASSQRCLRTVDLERGGQTARHLTYFEMLGNFSIGDYFKPQAVEMAWRYVTERLEIDPQRLWVSYFGGDQEWGLEPDEETLALWQPLLASERLVPLGREDNFWTLGQGPSGPCSELYYDRGEEWGCGAAYCRPGCDCDRYLEFWNLVFTQYDLRGQELTPLPRPNVDTGLGLERTLLILEDVATVHDTEPFREIAVDDHVVRDHLRAVAALLLEGVVPANQGRGYVMRRLFRRVVLRTERAGLDAVALLEPALARLQGDQGLAGQVDLTLLAQERERFAKTVSRGRRLVAQMPRVGAPEAFRLYETHGLPLETTLELLAERGEALDDGDLAEVEALMEEHRRRSRA
jgi:alanyl-tRNA synthetase